MKPEAIDFRVPDRPEKIRAVQNAMDVLNRKWTISILSSIFYYQSRRFMDLKKDIDGISNKQLSKELKILESDDLVTRTMVGKHPWYELTERGKLLEPIIEQLKEWGERVML